MDQHLLLIIPPEYFPTLESAACLLRADNVVLLDTAQYSRQSFQNRTRVRNPDGFQWLTIPITSGQFGESIADIRIDDASGWRRLHDKALRFNYSTSPFYLHYRPKLDVILDSGSEHLGDITSTAMQVTAQLLGSDATIERASNLEGRPDSTDQIAAMYPGAACLAPGSFPVSSSGAPPGSASTGSAGEPAGPDDRIVCWFEESPWRQNFAGFVSGMGSLDLLFNLGPRAREYLLANSRLSF